LGFYDMSGNVWEWCYDWFGDYPSSTQINPTGMQNGQYRLDRGGSWIFDSRICRVAHRSIVAPVDNHSDVGFRLARTEPVDEPDSKMILVEGGSFQMGNTRNDSEGRDNEKPVHTVNLTYDYRIGKYEVTFDEYDAFCDATGRSKPGDEGWGRGQRPVINVSWWDAIAYCNWLSDEEGYARAYDQNGNLLDKSGNITPDITKVEGYRLPTEAEWEYAARGGSADITNGNEANDYKYAGSNTLSEVGWYWDNSDRQTHPVGQKRPNELGLYDMSGNVEEWCHDRYDEEYYKKGTQTNPIGPSSGSDQVNRGRAWYYSEWYCRVADRGGSLVYGLLQGCRVAYLYIVEPPVSGIIDGFRLVRTVF